MRASTASAVRPPSTANGSIGVCRKRDFFFMRDTLNHKRRGLIRRTVTNPTDVLQEEEIGDRRQVHTGHGALSDRDVRLVPEADVRHLPGNEALHVGEECAPPGWIRRGRG